MGLQPSWRESTANKTFFNMQHIALKNCRNLFLEHFTKCMSGIIENCFQGTRTIMQQITHKGILMTIFK